MTNRLLFAALGAAIAITSTGCDKVKSMASGAGGSLFGGDFEGEITMNATRAKGSGPSQLVFGIKKPKYRIDATGTVQTDNPIMAGGASLILDPPAKKGYALIPAQKKAIVLDFDKMKSAQRGLPSGGAGGGGGGKTSSGPPPTVEKTGKKDVVAGYACEIWNVTSSNGQKSQICAADGITWIDLGDLGWSSPEITVAAVASGANRFPLRIISYGPTGAEEVRLEATKIEAKKLDDARFVVPPDYQVIDIAAMMQNLPILKGLPTK